MMNAQRLLVRHGQKRVEARAPWGPLGVLWFDAKSNYKTGVRQSLGLPRSRLLCSPKGLTDYNLWSPLEMWPP
jgi:hypothetical protein